MTVLSACHRFCLVERVDFCIFLRGLSEPTRAHLPPRLRLPLKLRRVLPMSHQEPLHMAGGWSFPHHQREQASSVVADPRPAVFPNAPTGRYATNAATEHCSCATCTGSASNRPPTWDTVDRQDWDTRPSSDTYTNRGQLEGINNPTGASFTAPVLAQMHFTAPGVQEQDSHAPSQATADTPQTSANIQPRQGPNIRISEAEILRRLADRYVNNPGSLVSVVRLEHGPSGGFQVVIMLEMADLL
ncbi:hypothetical protein EDB86DRAFT_566446 [Lactarius hatsudake]|nr:hypothetical protein EDB86DRAFT_566446 [Lactarius hatsudake]